MVSGFNSLTGIMRIVYNQYDSMVRPLWKWFEERGVQIRYETPVTALGLVHSSDGYIVDRITYDQGDRGEIMVGEKDFVLAHAWINDGGFLARRG